MKMSVISKILWVGCVGDISVPLMVQRTFIAPWRKSINPRILPTNGTKARISRSCSPIIRMSSMIHKNSSTFGVRFCSGFTLLRMLLILIPCPAIVRITTILSRNHPSGFAVISVKIRLVIIVSYQYISTEWNYIKTPV